MKKQIFLVLPALMAVFFLANTIGGSTDVLAQSVKKATVAKPAPAKTKKMTSRKPATKVSARKKISATKPKMKITKAVAPKPASKVAKVQMALNKIGASLKIDGKLGPKTRAAIKNFQKSNKIKATGRLNKATLAKLKV